MTHASTTWHQDWFDEDYLALYGHRDEAEARALVDHLEACHILPHPSPGHLLLDLGCGAGRHALALAQRGHAVLGLDWSPVLLHAGLRQRGDASWPFFVRGDLGALPLVPQCAAVVLSLFTSQGYHPDDAVNLGRWRGMLELVRPGGCLVLDYLNPAHVRSTLVPETRRQAGNGLVLEQRRVDDELNMVVKTITITRPAAPPRVVTEAVKLYQPAWFLKATWEEFSVRHHWGSLRGEAWAPNQPRSVLVLERSA